jgi:hypothetical protein
VSEKLIPDEDGLSHQTEELSLARQALNEIPVSINNFYGDPLIPQQWPNTLEQMDRLIESGHTGPVGIITKGMLRDRHMIDLSKRKDDLNLCFLISISELGEQERVGHDHRYENIRKLNEAEIPVIACLRPLMPPYNTTEEKMNTMFSGIAEAGGKIAVVSGFRGDDDLVEKMSPDEKVEWSLRVKVMPKDVYERAKRLAEQYGIQLFTRTACAVAYATGADRSYNPYYNSPNLVKCEDLECPLRETCGPLSAPKPGSMALLAELGYQVEFVPGQGKGTCGVDGADRLKCPSCCTTCYFTPDVPHMKVDGDIRLGDLAFVRFVTGVMAMQKGARDTGDKDIARVRFPNHPEIDNMQGLNSWLPIAVNTDRCYGCSYCIVSEYYDQNPVGQQIGFPPAELLDLVSSGDEDER